MKRLVYSPSINAWIKTDHGVVDISSYITECTVNRKIDEISRAIISFRNPKIDDGRFMFTEHEANGVIGPMFHPMDPIIITMTRIKGKPVQVFTGYCDTTAYVQLFPGIATIEASCTLKRLLHTYWDPGLSFVMDFMQQYGWSYDNVSGTSIMPNPAANDTPQLNDTGIGNLLGAMLNEVGGWEKDDILIQPFPSQAIEKQVGKIFDQLVQSGKDATQQYVNYISEYINAASAIGGAVSANGGGGGGGGGGDQGPVTETSIVTGQVGPNAVPWSFTGLASTYGSSHKYHYTDPGDDSYGNQGPSSGADPDVPGIAVRRNISNKPNYNWWVVRSPTGRTAALPQTDTGPAENTGRVLDVNTPAAVGVFGYKMTSSGVNFPTDGGAWKLYFAGTGQAGRAKAEKIVRDGRL